MSIACKVRVVGLKGRLGREFAPHCGELLNDVSSLYGATLDPSCSLLRETRTPHELARRSDYVRYGGSAAPPCPLLSASSRKSRL